MIMEITHHVHWYHCMSKTRPDRELTPDPYDVIVVGAGCGGISTAIQAARTGAETLLIEPTGHVGGQLLVNPTMDEGFVEGQGTPIRDAGLYAEFIDSIRQIYKERGKSVGTCYWQPNAIGFEPHVAEKVLREMLQDEPQVTLLTCTHVDAVLTEDHTVKGVTTTDGKAFHSKVLIDATEYGDLIPLTPARYRVGNATSDQIDPAACIQDITYPVVIEKYPHGAPSKFALEDPPPHYQEHIAQFERTIHEDGHNWYRNDCGETGDQTCWGKYPVNWVTHHAYRGLPNAKSPINYTADASQAAEISKTLINWANDIPVKVSYLEDASQREIDNWDAIWKTIGFLYYLQGQLGQDWSFSKDECYDSDPGLEGVPEEYQKIIRCFPPYPYIRESRRIIPLRTLTGSDIKRSGSPPRAERNFPHALAVGYYPADLHGCKEDQNFNASLEKGADIPDGFLSGPFQIPFEALIPEEVDGFLAAEKNIGVSRIANGATRLGPITMVTGQAVGIIAGLAVAKGLQPRHLDPVEVQLALLKEGLKLSLYAYQDVPRTHPLWPAVELATTHQLIEGKTPGELGVDEPISRAELAKALCLYLDLQVSPLPSSPTFQDVGRDHESHPYIEAIHAYLPFPTADRGEGRFRPHDPVRREEMAYGVVRALQRAPYQGEDSSFGDVPRERWSHPWIETACRWGIMQGDDQGAFHPAQTVTKGDAARIFYRLFQRGLDQDPPG